MIRTHGMDRRGFVVGAAGLALAPVAAARRFGGTPTALVTADLQSQVVAVDITTGKVIRRIGTAPDPRAIESALQTTAIVCHTAHGQLTLIDGPSLTIRAELGGFGEPRYVVVQRGGRYAYVTDSARRELVTVDLIRRRIVHRLDVLGPARHLSLHPSGRLLWTSLGNKAAQIAVVSLDNHARPRLSGTFHPPFLAHDVGFAPGGRTVWITGGDERRLAIFEAAARKRIRIVRGDAAPQHVTFFQRAAFVASGDDGLLRVYALDGRLITTRRLPTGSYNVQQDWDVVVSPSLSRGTLCVLDRRARVRHELRVARSSHDACFVVSA
jgi:DNA-binding beta-propeller fold protein YncE